MTVDLDEFGRAMDGVTATGNLAMAAIKVRYRASVLSEDAEHVVLMVPAAEWRELVDQNDMFLAVVNHFNELEGGQ